MLFKTTNKLKNYFRFKDLLPEIILIEFINFCVEATQLLHRYDLQMLKSKGFKTQRCFTKNRKTCKSHSFGSIAKDHMLVCDHQVALENFRSLGNETNKFILELKESLFIKEDKPTLNRTSLLTNCYCHFE